MSFKNFSGKIVALVIVFFATVLISGCGHFFKPPKDDAHARLVLDRLLQNNSALNQYKGLAKLQMRVNGTRQKVRIAFAAVRPDKMRVELLSVMGTPLTSLSGDGHTVTIISHADRKQYRFRQTRTALAKLIDIPIGIEDLQSLLAGRVPLPRHMSVQAMAGHSDEKDAVILLKDRWDSIVAKLHMDQTTQHIKSLHVMDPEGELQYQIQWIKWRAVEGYALPEKLSIVSADNRKLTLTMDRFWPNATVPPSTFVLELEAVSIQKW